MAQKQIQVKKNKQASGGGGSPRGDNGITRVSWSGKPQKN
jgi:hypothetical protein